MCYEMNKIFKILKNKNYIKEDKKKKLVHIKLYSNVQITKIEF